MEKDDEVNEEKGSSYTSEFRQFDPNIGRWTSIDPITHHNLSPYNAFDGNPIYYKDPSGANSEGGEDDDCEESCEEANEPASTSESSFIQFTEGAANSDNSIQNLSFTNSESVSNSSLRFGRAVGNEFNKNVGILQIGGNRTLDLYTTNYYNDKSGRYKKDGVTVQKLFMDEPNNWGNLTFGLNSINENATVSILYTKQKFEAYENGFQDEALSTLGIGVGFEKNISKNVAVFGGAHWALATSSTKVEGVGTISIDDRAGWIAGQTIRGSAGTAIIGMDVGSVSFGATYQYTHLRAVNSSASQGSVNMSATNLHTVSFVIGARLW